MRSMGDRSSYVLYTGFCTLYLGQALWAHFLGRELWFGRVLVFVNQWAGVLEVAALCAAAAALVKAQWFSEGRLVTGAAGLGWSGPPSGAAKVFAAVFFLVAVPLGVLLVRAPARSALANVALFLGPGSATCVAVALWLALLF